MRRTRERKRDRERDGGKKTRKEGRKNGEPNELPATRLAGRVQSQPPTVAPARFSPPRALPRHWRRCAHPLPRSSLSLLPSRFLSHFDPLGVPPYFHPLLSLSLFRSLLDAFSHLAIGLPRRFKRRAGTYDAIGYRISAGSPIGRSPRTVAAPARQLRLICYVKTSIASIPSLVPPSGARPLVQPPSTLPYPTCSPPTHLAWPPLRRSSTYRHRPQRVPLVIEEGTE